MNFLAETFAKHILCLFFSTKAFMCYVLNFFEKKAFMCLFNQVNYIELFGQSLCFGQIVLVMCLFFSKKAFMCLIGHVLVKNEWILLRRIYLRNLTAINFVDLEISREKGDALKSTIGHLGLTEVVVWIFYLTFIRILWKKSPYPYYFLGICITKIGRINCNIF